MFWIRYEETPVGECRIHNPIPHTTLAEDGETLVVQALWPTPEADEFCWEFVAKEETETEPMFNIQGFIEWLNMNYTEDYLVDIYPNEGSPGISGRIARISPDNPFPQHKKDNMMRYLQEYFAPEDIDVSFT
jgi:hypothetical protein